MGNAHASLTGRVKWWNGDKGFGFIVSGGVDYFAHFKAIKSKDKRKNLIEGETVSFTPVENVKGMKAEDVEVIEIDGNQ